MILYVSSRLLIIVCAIQAAPGAQGPAKSQEPGDCGTLALYSLLQIEGFPASLNVISSQLPPYRPAGYSMNELRIAARSLGLVLDGAFLGRSADPIDRPMLAFLKVDSKGHFLVIRPAGHTGKLVQVIDSNQPPRVMEKVDLVASEQWTGLVLAPRRTSWWTVGIASLPPLLMGGFLIAVLRRTRMKKLKVALDGFQGGPSNRSIPSKN
jgi:hypothetical protein